MKNYLYEKLKKSLNLSIESESLDNLIQIVLSFSKFEKNYLIIDKKALKNIIKKEIYKLIPDKIKILDKNSEFRPVEKVAKSKNKYISIFDKVISDLLESEDLSKIYEILDKHIDNVLLKLELLEEIKSVLLKKEELFIDPLTKVLNQSFYIKFLSDDLNFFKRKSDIAEFNGFLLNLKKEYKIAYIDIGNFKAINDLYSHSIGDYFLKEIIKKLISLTNNQIIPIRAGGDEFIFIGPEEALNKLNKVYKKEFLKEINNLIKDKNNKTPYDKGYPIYIGVGFSKENLSDLKFFVKNIKDIEYNKKIFKKLIISSELDCSVKKDVLRQLLEIRAYRNIKDKKEKQLTNKDKNLIRNEKISNKINEILKYFEENSNKQIKNKSL